MNVDIELPLNFPLAEGEIFKLKKFRLTLLNYTFEPREREKKLVGKRTESTSLKTSIDFNSFFILIVASSEAGTRTERKRKARQRALCCSLLFHRYPEGFPPPQLLWTLCSEKTNECRRGAFRALISLANDFPLKTKISFKPTSIYGTFNCALR